MTVRKRLMACWDSPSLRSFDYKRMVCGGDLVSRWWLRRSLAPFNLAMVWRRVTILVRSLASVERVMFFSWIVGGGTKSSSSLLVLSLKMAAETSKIFSFAAWEIGQL